MKLPLFPQQNFAMHLTGSSLVELFPKFQLLDFHIYLDRFCIDFSFSRKLSEQELVLVMDRFQEKVKSEIRGDVKEMVSKNACDLFKYYKQIFLTELVDREEQFCPVFCLGDYNAPLFGEIDQDGPAIKDIQFKLHDLGEKKWMKRRVHHYRLEGTPFFDKKDRGAFSEVDRSKDHLRYGEKNKLFWVKDGDAFFSGAGKRDFCEFLQHFKGYFGELVSCDGGEEAYHKLSGDDEFFTYSLEEGQYDGICYGLKETSRIRMLTVYCFSETNIEKKFDDLMVKLGLLGTFDEDGRFIIFDYRGIPLIVAEVFYNKNCLILEINLQTLYALSIENSLK